MARLTQAERKAILSALAFMGAGEFDECAGDDPGFTQEDMESAGDKIANGLKLRTAPHMRIGAETP